jgi:hypothetical protein
VKVLRLTADLDTLNYEDFGIFMLMKFNFEL